MEAEKRGYEERMRPALEAARREAEAKAEADAEARRAASAAMSEAEAQRCQEAAAELKLAAGVSLAVLDLPRLMRAVDAADEAGVDREQARITLP